VSVFSQPYLRLKKQTNELDVFLLCQTSCLPPSMPEQLISVTTTILFGPHGQITGRFGNSSSFKNSFLPDSTFEGVFCSDIEYEQKTKRCPFTFDASSNNLSKL
jgi:hypothetical protein